MFKTLFDLELSSKLSAVNEIQNVNCGGCGFVAKAIFQYLKNRGYEPKYVCIYGFWGPYAHVMVEVDGLWVDSTGVYIPNEDNHPTFHLGEFDYKEEEVFEDDLINTNWNPMFNQENIPTILKIIS